MIFDVCTFPIRLILFVATLTAVPVQFAGAQTKPEATPTTVDFVREVRPIFERHCYDCHSDTEYESGLRLDIKSIAMKGGDNHGPDIVPGKPADSPLYRFLVTQDQKLRMPPDARLADSEIEIIKRWIEGGANWPDGIDTAQVVDRLDHWSFKPLRTAEVSDTLDRFIDTKLAASDLSRSPAAEPVQWLRRVTFDLTGLPPTREEASKFKADLAMLDRPTVYSQVVDRLLASPRYGERWAQHWLDVVRYADTHGFEVNTERPNAWPYRDYVIEAFNGDTPYDRFILEQLVGDALGKDAATGFLVTASVLLPGQIGKDEPSIRLARQDALDEIVNNIGQTFLGLSIGCARCHDHKFDPISAKDYYSMQAFVAGVEYEDREMSNSQAASKKEQAVAVRAQVKELEQKLTQYTPLARPNHQVHTTDPKENTLQFEPVLARYVRFTIDDCNLHPALGLIEPCIDEFEIFTDEVEPRNVALGSLGTRVKASGSNISASHKLKHINDGLPGNARSWMSDTAGRGWVQFELPEPMKISKVVWSRDRDGKLTDRLATAYRLEAGLENSDLKVLAQVAPLRPAVNRRGTTDHITPIKAKRLRFTIDATNSLDPCLDELEIFNVQGENVALASRGAQVTVSGSRSVENRHDASFVNDGRYGNSNSWLGNEPGKGWVEIEFEAVQEVSRVVWSRDRDGPFEDRLPIVYRIEVADLRDATPEGANVQLWQCVADSTDRRPWIAGMDLGPTFSLAGLMGDELTAASKLLDEKRALEGKIKSLETGQLAFAGKFRAPDAIQLLNRGDPEQPLEQVPPAVPQAFGRLELPFDAGEQARRKAIAEWIASPHNPLTARVMVNRIWQGHFGMGLVETSSDFGRNGTKPTHPELLDWLATQFIASGWSIKHMHRLIVLSDTYCQSSVSSNATANGKDADVRLLWRFPSRRLEAEVIRDSMLAISGELNLLMNGRGFNLFQQRGGLSGFVPVESFKSDGLRRMIYAHKVRREREAVFGAFDCPDAGQSTARRRESTTPLQALNLFNSSFTLERSAALAKRLAAESSAGVEAQITTAFEIVFNREPSPRELEELPDLVAAYGLKPFCRALLNSNEALFLP